MAVSITTRLRYWLARSAYKAAALPFVPPWVSTSWLEPSFDRLTREGYNANAAVFSCVVALTFSYQQPRLVVYNRRSGELIPEHPLQALLDRPNPAMGAKALAVYSMTYKAIGGNTYLHKVRNREGRVIELWPYHAGHMTPVPGVTNWTESFEYNVGDGRTQRIPTEDVVHLKWLSIDTANPWLALPPLKAIAREVDTDNEASRYLYALLVNDAVPRTVIELPAGKSLTDTSFERLRAQFSARHGGDRRGNVAVIEGGGRINRMALNLEELAFDALRRVPETRIAAAFRVPAMIAGLNAGMERSTYSNHTEARRQYTEDTLIPMWELDADELSQELADEWPGGIGIRYDLSTVAALRENEDAKWQRVTEAWNRGLMGRKEARRLLGLPDDLAPDDEFRASVAERAQEEDEPALLELPQRALRALPRPEKKDHEPARRERLEQQLRQATEAYLRQQYQRALDRLGEKSAALEAPAPRRTRKAITYDEQGRPIAIEDVEVVHAAL